MSADGTEISALLPRLRPTVKSSHLNDLYNADEFGFFNRQALRRTFSRKGRVPSAHKKDKMRKTFLAAFNASGTDKMPLLIISKSFSPRPFFRK